MTRGGPVVHWSTVLHQILTDLRPANPKEQPMPDQTTRWGLGAPDWAEIRHIPRGEEDARRWAAAFASGTRKTRAHDVTVYRDTGNGWEPVDTYPAGGVQ